MNKNIILLLIAIITIGTFLRIYNLDQESLWTDEAYSISHAQEPINKINNLVVQTEAAPAGYYYLLHYWIKATNNEVFNMRLLSVIFSIFSIPLIYLLTAKLFNKEVALITSLLFSTSMLQILYSQEIRLYSLSTFITLLSTYLLVKYIKKEYPIYPYILINILALYINYMAIFLIALQLLAIFTYKPVRKFTLPIIKANITVGIFFIPWIPNLLIQILLRHKTLQFSLAIKQLLHFLYNLGIFFRVIPMAIILATLIIAYLINRKYNFIKKCHESKYAWIIITLILATLYITFFQTISKSFAIIRHIFFLALILYIYLALKIKHNKAIFLFIILLFNAFAITAYYNNTTKAEWNKAAEYIQDTNPTIMVDKSGFGNNVIFNYYFNQPYTRVNLTYNENQQRIRIPDNQIPKTDNFYLVQYRSPDKDYYPTLFPDYAEKVNFHQITIYKYE